MIRDCREEEDPGKLVRRRRKLTFRLQSACFSLHLHDGRSLRLLHFTQDGSEDLVQLIPELRSSLRDERRHQPSHEGSGELGVARIQQLVDHLHDVPEAAVALLVTPLGDLLQANGYVRPQALPSILEEMRRSTSNDFQSNINPQ